LATISSSSLPTDSADKRPMVASVSCRSNIASAAPRTRSIRVVFGGSILTSRQRASSVLRSRSDITLSYFVVSPQREI
jgi:hypothetical protein